MFYIIISTYINAQYSIKKPHIIQDNSAEIIRVRYLKVVQKVYY